MCFKRNSEVQAYKSESLEEALHRFAGLCEQNLDVEFSDSLEAWQNYQQQRLSQVAQSLSEINISYSKSYKNNAFFTEISAHLKELTSRLSLQISSESTACGYDTSYIPSKTKGIIFNVFAEINSFIAETIITINNEAAKESEDRAYLSNNNRIIFIVHGRNHLYRDQLKLELEKLNFTVEIMEKEPNAGRFLLSKFIDIAKKASCAIVLLSAEDKVIGEGEEENRARQNVVFELGFFISRLGQSRVILFADSGLTAPTDIEGLAWQKLAPGTVWISQAISELRSMGFDINQNNNSAK